MRRKAFTLIELLIVVAIIAILAAIALPNFLEAQTRAKVTRVRSDFRQILVAMEAYRVDYNAFPPDDGVNWYDDYRPLTRLTSPVPYITTVPTSPFYDLSRTRQNLPSGAPDRSNYAFWGADRHPPLLPILFHLVSCGPNQIADGLGGRPGNEVEGRLPNFVNRIYDPTNGTVSYGDLMVHDRGLVF